MEFRKKRLCLNTLVAIMVCLTIMLGIFAMSNLLFLCVYQKTQVAGNSMAPTLNSYQTNSKELGDIVYVNRYSNYKNNDIVVADVNWLNSPNPVIKRLVAVPNDELTIAQQGDEYILVVNNCELYRKAKTLDTQNYVNIFNSYLDNHADSVVTNAQGQRCLKLNQNQYFLMGDNWKASMIDSSTHGPISKSALKGKVDLIVHSYQNKPHLIFMYLLKCTFTKK